MHDLMKNMPDMDELMEAGGGQMTSEMKQQMKKMPQEMQQQQGYPVNRHRLWFTFKVSYRGATAVSS